MNLKHENSRFTDFSPPLSCSGSTILAPHTGQAESACAAVAVTATADKRGLLTTCSDHVARNSRAKSARHYLAPMSTRLWHLPGLFIVCDLIRSSQLSCQDPTGQLLGSSSHPRAMPCLSNVLCSHCLINCMNFQTVAAEAMYAIPLVSHDLVKLSHMKSKAPCSAN